MPISGNCVWEVRTDGATTNGGGFVAGASGVDYSQQAAAHTTQTDLVIDGADNTKVTSAGHPFDADCVGNIMQITAGTGFTQTWYEIKSVLAGVATLDKAAGTVGSTGGTYSLGGAFAITGTNVDSFFEVMTPGNTCWIKTGTHTVTTPVSAGADGSAGSYIRVVGYNSTRGDAPEGANRPLISAGSNTLQFDDYWQIENLRTTGTGTTLLRGDTECVFANCSAVNSSGSAGRPAYSTGSSYLSFYQCDGESTAGAAFSPGLNATIVACTARDSATGFAMPASSNVGIEQLDRCVVDSCTVGIDNTVPLVGKMVVHGCTFYGCGTAIAMGDIGVRAVNCAFRSNTIAVDLSLPSTEQSVFVACLFSGNGTDVNGSGPTLTYGAIASSDPLFTDAAGGDFTTTAASPCRGAGLGVKSSNGSVSSDSSIDLGAWQAGSSGGGYTPPTRRIGIRGVS